MEVDLEFDEAVVRTVLEQETVPQIKLRIEEMNAWREGQGIESMISSGPKARLLDALVACYREAHLDTAGAIELPEGEPEASPEVLTATETAAEPDTGEPVPGAALVPLKPPEQVMPSQQEYAAMRAIAQEICRTEFVSSDFRGRPEAVLASILTGRELGIGPMQSLKDISIIDGKPSLSASLMMALMRKGGVQILESTSTKELARIKARRSDTGEVMEVEWTFADAEMITQRGGKPLTVKDNWKNYPADMLWARAVGRLGRRLAPDILGGMGYSAEEMADFEGGWDDSPYDQAPTGQVTRPSEWLPPSDWRDLWARLALALGGVDELSSDEAAEWMAEAVRAKFGKQTSELSPTERGEAWQMFLRALLEIEKVRDDLAFDPDVRERVAEYLKEFGALVGPQWRLSPSEESIPTYYEVHGKPEPTAPGEVEEAEWTPLDTETRQTAWNEYVAAERVAHPQWDYPQEVPDDWSIGEEHVPF